MIKVIYNKTCGRCVQSEPLTSGMVGQPIHFEYSHDFDGLTLTAVFTNGKTTVDVLNPGNQCVIPHEVLDTVGTLVKVGIYAVRGNELVIPTVYANIGVVQKGADPSGDASADPTLPVWAQIQGIIGNLNDLDTEAKNNLVAAINEAAQTGSGSASIAMRVEGGYIQYSTDNGKTWVNLIAEADLKGDKGDKGDPGTPGKDGTDMGITGATVGQIAKITAVDASGVPTAWSPVDMPTGGGGSSEGIGELRRIAKVTLTEDAASIEITTDENGNAFELVEYTYLIMGKSLGTQGNVGLKINDTPIYYETNLSNTNTTATLISGGHGSYVGGWYATYKASFNANGMDNAKSSIKGNVGKMEKFWYGCTSGVAGVGFQAGTVLELWGR